MKNPKAFAQICGIDPELITIFWDIYCALSSCLPIDPVALEIKCEQWLDIYFDQERGCSWYVQSPSVHKMFAHSYEIVRATPINIGYLSEEPSEQSRVVKPLLLHRLQSHKASKALLKLGAHLAHAVD